jgi:hypothetical protein
MKEPTVFRLRPIETSREFVHFQKPGYENHYFAKGFGPVRTINVGGTAIGST